MSVHGAQNLRRVSEEELLRIDGEIMRLKESEESNLDNNRGVWQAVQSLREQEELGVVQEDSPVHRALEAMSEHLADEVGCGVRVGEGRG